jgi:bis(5'-nucleosyl)-tetraphosphatase (symmetrical)
MRFITPDNLLDFNAKEATTNSSSLIPWFSHPAIMNAQHDLIFGHWAALEGKTPYNHLYALDTGCVWGGSMTLIELQSKQKFSEKSQLLSK